MALTMARPWRNKHGVYSLRQRTPADLIQRVRGQKVTLPVGEAFAEATIGEMVQVSLRTHDPAQARSLHSAADAALRRYWDAARRGPQSLSHKQVTALAGELYGVFATALEDNPGPPERWQSVRETNAQAQAGTFGLLARFGIGLTADERRAASIEARFGGFADAILAKHGLIVDEASRTRLVLSAARALDEAAGKLERNAAGDFRPDDAAARFPTWEASPQPSGPTLLELYETWAEHPENAGVARRTKAAYRGAVAAASSHLGHPKAATITTPDLRRYFDTRMTAQEGRLQPRVARDVHKAAISSIFTWAVGRGVVPTNPVAGITIKVTSKPQLRAKEATDEETLSLVGAALALPPAAPRGTLDAARRWVTLLLVYTGCRVGEVTQLRGQDVTDHHGIPLVRVTPEAGTVKDRELRMIPLHPRLVELGFLDFVRSAGDGPLFIDASKRRRADAATPLSEMVADGIATWARANGLSDTRLKRPLHALRHRFSTLVRWAGIGEQYLEAITGHSTGRQSREYGRFPIEVLHRELVKLRPEVMEGRAKPFEG